MSDPNLPTADPPADPAGGPTLTVVVPSGNGPAPPTPGAAPPTLPVGPPAPPPPGRLPDIPGYLVEAELARGGMGVVYKARHVRLNRPAAIKMILTGRYLDPVTRARFQVEAEAVARLRHPHVVTVYEYGEVDGLPFLAMEFVGGGTLAARIDRDGRPTPREAAAIVAALAAGVAAAHASGVVHRDLKPSNVLLTEAGDPKVADFGVAKVGGDAGVTITGAVIGTPGYMAPEQARGEGRAAGPAADVYALGAILYELLVGRPPFRAATPMATLGRVLTEDPDRPRAVAPHVPRDLETICLKCLDRDYRRRYATAGAVGDDLRAFLAGRPIAARPVGPGERAVKWVCRNPAVAVLAGLLVAVAAGGLAAVLGQYREAQAARGEAADRADREARAKELAQTALGDAEANLYLASLTLAEREWVVAEADGARAALARCPPGLRRWEWHYLAGRDRGLLDLPAAGGAVAYSPDGTKLATGGPDGGARVWDGETGRPVATFPGHGGTVWTVGWTRDGDGLVVPEGRTIRVYDLAAPSAPPAVLGPHAGPVIGVAHHPTKPWLAAAVGDPLKPDAAGEVVVWDRTTGKRVHTLTGHTGAVYAAAFSPDGTLLATGGEDMTVAVWDAEAGKRLRVLAGHKAADAGPAFGAKILQVLGANGRSDFTRLVTAPVFRLAFSPDGRLLASASGDTTARLWDPNSGADRGTLAGHGKPVFGVAFSPSGRLVATAGMDRTVRLWDAATAREFRRYPGPGAIGAGVVFRPPRPGETARLAVAGGGRVVVRDPDQPADAYWWRGPTGNVFGLAFAPDGRSLAAGSGDLFNPLRAGQIRVLGLPDKRELFALPGHAAGVGGLAYSPDGKLLASGGGDGTVKLWDLATRKELWTSRVSDLVIGLAYSPDGGTVAVATASLLTLFEPGKIILLDAATGAERATLAGHAGKVGCLAYSPDGKRLASGSADRTVKLWDTATGAEVRTLTGSPAAVIAVGWSPDGKSLVGGGGLLPFDAPAEARVWDAATGEERLVLRGHAEVVTGVGFTADGERVVTGSRDGTAKVWDARTGRPLLTLRTTSHVCRLGVDPKGRWVAAGTWTGVVYLWDGGPAD